MELNWKTHSLMQFEGPLGYEMIQYVQRPSSSGANRVCTRLLRYLTCSIKSRVWIWEAEYTVCPVIYLYLNLTQRLV